MVADPDALRSPNERGKRPSLRSVRYSTLRISPTVTLDGYLEVFIEGRGDRRWQLPAQSDRDEIARVANQAKAWAIQDGQATQGQLKYIQKALSDAGYHVRTPRRYT